MLDADNSGDNKTALGAHAIQRQLTPGFEQAIGHMDQPYEVEKYATKEALFCLVRSGLRVEKSLPISALLGATLGTTLGARNRSHIL